MIVLTMTDLGPGKQPAAIAGKCHTRSEQLVFYMLNPSDFSGKLWGGVVAVRCKTCNKHVANVAMDQDTQDEIASESEDGTLRDAIRLKGTCHPKHGMFLVYSEGAILAACGGCKKMITRLGVREKSA